MGARFKQVDSESGEVWKEPPGPEVADLEGEEFEDAYVLDIDDALPLLEAMLEHLGIKVPWYETNESEVGEVQKLASRLKPINWDAAVMKGVSMGDDEELASEVWERFRTFVVDAARSCNGIEWEVDDW